MQTVKIYRLLQDAHFDRSRLSDAGIDSIVEGEQTGTIGYGGLFDEIRLAVADDDLDEALKVIEEKPLDPFPADAEFEDVPQKPIVDAQAGGPPAWTFFLGGGIAALLLFTMLFMVVESPTTIKPSAGEFIATFLCGGLLGAGFRVFFIRGSGKIP
jgi:hypothetical protein